MNNKLESMWKETVVIKIETVQTFALRNWGKRQNRQSGQWGSGFRR